MAHSTVGVGTASVLVLVVTVGVTVEVDLGITIVLKPEKLARVAGRLVDNDTG